MKNLNWLFFLLVGLIIVLLLTNTIATCNQKQQEVRIETVIDRGAIKSAIDSTNKANLKAQIKAIDSTQSIWRNKYNKAEKSLTSINRELATALAAYENDTASQSEKCNEALEVYQVKVDTLTKEVYYVNQALFDCETLTSKQNEILIIDSIAIERKDEEIKQLAKEAKRTYFEKKGISIGFVLGATIVEVINILK